MKYKIWDGKEELVTPIGEVLSPEKVIERYPAAGKPGMKFIIADQPVSLAVFMELQATKDFYRKQGAAITDGMTDAEALAAISDFEDNPPAAPPAPEERTAAALEFQNILALPDSQGTATDDAFTDLVERNYKRGLWNKAMLDVAVGKGAISAAKRDGITKTTK